MYQVSNGAMGERRKLSEEQFGNMLKDTKQKNGFVMAVYEFTVMNQQLQQMKTMCQNLVGLIDNVLESDD